MSSVCHEILICAHCGRPVDERAGACGHCALAQGSPDERMRALAAERHGRITPIRGSWEKSFTPDPRGGGERWLWYNDEAGSTHIVRSSEVAS